MHIRLCNLTFFSLLIPTWEWTQWELYTTCKTHDDEIKTLTFSDTKYLISAANWFASGKNLGQIHSLLIQLLFQHFLIWLSAFWNGSTHLPSNINNSEFMLVFRRRPFHTRRVVQQQHFVLLFHRTNVFAVQIPVCCYQGFFKTSDRAKMFT